MTLLSSQGVFDKYKVENFTVKEDAVRYYDITAIFRAWITEDGENGTDNTIDYVSCEVGQLWTAVNFNDTVSYSYTISEVIIVENKWAGTLRYKDNSNLFEQVIDSHFVAFSTDRDIDKLLAAKVSYYAQGEIYYCNGNGLYYESDGDPYFREVELSYTDKVVSEVGGIFNNTYEWKRIQSTEAFIAGESERLSSSTITNLEDKEWVLRYFESDHEYKGAVNLLNYEEHYTVVRELTILRLDFETNGQFYSLGVVDNKITPDNKDDSNGPTTEGLDNAVKDFLESLGKLGKLGSDPPDWWEILVMIIGIVVVCIVLSALKPILSIIGDLLVGLFNAILWVLKLPFTLLGLLFKPKNKNKR